MSNTEVELKLLIDSSDIPRLQRHSLLKALCPSGPKTRKLTSIYFDTDDFFLKNRGIALRVRRSGRQWIQTVKGGGSVQAGLHQRDEWEAPVAHSTPDFTKIIDPGLIRLFASDGLRQRLHSVFVTEFSRTIWLLETEAGDQVEMALDQGEIRSDQGSVPICEVELELKVGNPAVLYELALALQEAVPLHPENASKADRGYALCAPQEVALPVRAAAPEVRREMTVNEAFHAIAWNCIDQLQGNRNRLLQGYDPELIHQMRVAVRRLRSALGLFAAAAPGIQDAVLTEALRWLVGELGPARDWDVFLGEMLPPVVMALPEEEGLVWLQRQAENICREKREQACVAAAGQRYNEIMLRLGAWLWRAPWRTSEVATDLDMPVSVFAAKMLDRRYRQVCRRGRHLMALTVAQRHELRIAAKKLRYAAEFFSGLYPGKTTKRYIQALSRLQDEFGALNDQAVAGTLLAQIGTGSRLRDRASGVIIGWYACKTHLQLADMAQEWKRFRHCRTFWKKG
ncbi:adenylate cyclase [Sulfuricella denitrificans skB26]|uniref:Adenylate cyclase n=1 Tax=Sulfuricella denitrificans (strain DSM 22764 / NBRC 105220 / skB26) TaxID=1163617 RepID=S6AMZ5_SULDS|nr:CYTH and CHAD domain-containing protein [Sulfuricella denitrificans]BAN36189.1 adenylate cyclase [Sulfuricella denitrificans skB26]